MCRTRDLKQIEQSIAETVRRHVRIESEHTLEGQRKNRERDKEVEQMWKLLTRRPKQT